eukprot:CAMPEP_0113632008 /NCGR_PEP_ID=MMETSP0017_2-20120614/16635_1 /TAXON_ID=2856 /ORGANISM="Cylindrotheca closterium" /LENGTH=180 /DNA_ID=CAMNT_0000542543 /DNA_START=78 /DNA_END=619 /DNA_ORIENTATION=- /assembly_acc=CAM_ASM_000147
MKLASSFKVEAVHAAEALIPPKVVSRAVNLLGGEDSLDFLTIYFAERIADDDVLSAIYCRDLNSKALVQLQKVLLLLALSDELGELTSGSKKKVYNQNILQKHVRLGLMEKEENFDRLASHLADALATCQIKDTRAIFKTQRRFAALRPLLDITQEHMELQSQQIESIRFPFLGKFASKK